MRWDETDLQATRAQDVYHREPAVILKSRACQTLMFTEVDFFDSFEKAAYNRCEAVEDTLSSDYPELPASMPPLS